MPHKIRLFFVFLVLIAGVFVLNFFGTLKDTYRIVSSFNKNYGSELANLDNDVDNDGLSNKEESYWNTDFQNPDTDGDGYLDGEEVSAGHDPRVAGPGDLLNKPKNITDNLTTRITAGIYSKDLKKTTDKQRYDKAVDDLSLAVIYDFYDSPTINELPALILVNDSKENQEKYLNNISDTIKKHLLDFPQAIDANKPLEDQWDFFLVKAQQFKVAFNEVSDTPVPNEWRSVHENVLDILNRLYVNYNSVGSFELDPFRSLLAINELQTIDSEIKEILKRIQAKVTNNYLNPRDSFYQILSLLYQ